MLRAGCVWTELLLLMAAANAKEGAEAVPLTDTQADAAFESVRRHARSCELWVLPTRPSVSRDASVKQEDHGTLSDNEQKAIATLKPLNVEDACMRCVRA